MARFRASNRRRTRPRGGRRATRSGRRSAAKTRRSRRSPRMSNKRILNLTSRKKRDVMPPAELLADGLTWEAQKSNIPGEGGTIHMFFWPATARNKFTLSPIYTPHQRQLSNCFMKGLKFVSHMEIATGAPWEWRQIIFAVKGLANAPFIDSYVSHDAALGYMRGQREVVLTAQEDLIQSMLFKGLEGVDWLSPMVAPIDTHRVNVIRDKTRILKSGNEHGNMMVYKDYIPLNKSIQYDDDESGGADDTSRWSVTSKLGMGDVFVVDYFRTTLSATSADLLQWGSNATLYWHER
ncbi:MAG: capsid protein [Genomoviridae sp.]|nr:MAG: capsid protein [Genomoviridae sp.]